ncbi:hypothetical protein HUJ04_012161 [Dendroctonus ponderosae]|nr:hypothetical protein HUJ04_012161 [Dendroctonus ponderosae]
MEETAGDFFDFYVPQLVQLSPSLGTEVLSSTGAQKRGSKDFALVFKKLYFSANCLLNARLHVKFQPPVAL